MPLNYSRWKHRITFSIAPVTTVDGRWVTLTLPWRPGINPDYSDIRLTNTAGNSLSYNIGSKTDRVTATVKIEIPIAGTQLIHLYYGNSQTVSESTAAGTEDASPVLIAVSGTTNPEYSGAWTLRQGGRLNQQKYTSGVQSGPYPRWKNKALIKITNPVSQTNYQHKISLSWLPGMRSDFRDIRFAQLNGKKCDYWIESYTSRVSAVVWIEVPTAGQRWLNLYYGNGRATSESNGDNTFDFFDNFETGTISPTKWPTGYASYSVISSSPYQGRYSVYRWNTGVSIISKSLGTLSYHVIEGAFKFAQKTDNHAPIGYDKNLLIARETGYWGYYTGSGYVDFATPYNANTWYNVKLALDKSINTYYVYINGTLIGTVTNNSFFNAGAPTTLNIRNGLGSNWGGIYFDQIRVRKYAPTEPTLSLVSHLPNPTRIIPYETLDDQSETEGNHYIMDPIETALSLSGSIGATILQPLISSGLKLQSSISGLTWSTIIEAELSLSGSVLTKNYIPLNSLDITQFSVSKAVSDDIWAMNATIDGYTALNTNVLLHATFATTDHLGVSHSIFAGILPKSSYTIQDAANKTVISGYDYAWYLSRQQVQAAYQHNVASVNPADIITGLLGGDDWEETTGIMPYKINPVTAWGETLNSKVFDFAIGTNKKQAIEKICAYCRFVFLVKWIVVEGIATAAAYFISEDDIDTELDLPDPVTFTYPDPYLADSIKPVVRGDERYNRVTVIGRNNSGGVFSATVESPAVTAKDELPIEKIENSGSWTTQEQVNARAQELFEYYSETAYTFTAKAIDRMDLELLQKIRIIGYTGVSESWMRITRIKKNIRATKDGVEKTVEIEFTENVKWSALRRMYRYSSDDMTSEVETIVDDKIAQIPGMQVGTCTAIDGQAGTVVLESGETVTTRVV